VSKIAQLWRTTTVRLTAIFILLFVIFSILLLTFLAYQSSIQIQQQQTRAIDREVEALERIDSRQGVRGIVFAMARLASQPGPGLYYLGDNSGLQIVGNIANIPQNVLESEGVFSFDYSGPAFDQQDETAAGPQGYAVVRSLVLDSGLRLVVGRDVIERRGFTAIVFQGFFYAVIGILVFSVLAGVITSRRVLKRIDAINATSAKIMSGNLGERIPVTKANDEFDTLATSLNAMLDRIEGLMQGLKEVTDNVAHDLKTPLTRLRTKAEAALRESASGDAQREALETTISESDKLIKTFNALLMIASRRCRRALRAGRRRAGAHARDSYRTRGEAPRQSRADRPGPGQPHRECPQILRAGGGQSWQDPPRRACHQRPCSDRSVGQWSRHSGGGPPARHRTLCAA
jgi:signal transduction histidine kinase